MAFQLRHAVVDAVQIQKGSELGTPGEWIVTDIDGEQYKLSDADFRARFEGADDAGKQALVAKDPAHVDREYNDEQRAAAAGKPTGRKPFEGQSPTRTLETVPKDPPRTTSGGGVVPPGTPVTQPK